MQPPKYWPKLDINCLDQPLFLKSVDLRWVFEDAAQDSMRAACLLPLASVDAISLLELQSLYLILFRWPLLAKKFSRLSEQGPNTAEPSSN